MNYPVLFIEPLYDETPDGILMPRDSYVLYQKAHDEAPPVYLGEGTNEQMASHVEEVHACLPASTVYAKDGDGVITLMRKAVPSS